MSRTKVGFSIFLALLLSLIGGGFFMVVLSEQARKNRFPQSVDFAWKHFNAIDANNNHVLEREELQTASSRLSAEGDSATLLNVLDEYLESVGHVIDTRKVLRVVPSMSPTPPHITTLSSIWDTVTTYGISREDLEKFLPGQNKR
jgi:hypothetical protein